MSTDLGGMKGRRVLITGAAGPGIGQACARLFAEHGADVILSDRSASRSRAVAAAVAAATGAKVIPHVMDVGDEAAVEAGMAEVLADGPLDVLVNNAAYAERAPIAEMSNAGWRKVIDICLTGTFLTMRACLPGMIARRSGAIVNIASVAAWNGPSDGTGAYAAAKAGVLGLTRAAAAECGPYNVRVNAVAPGLVPNSGIEALFGAAYIEEQIRRTPMARPATPDEIARAVFFLAGEQSSFITGDVLCVSGGLYFHA